MRSDRAMLLCARARRAGPPSRNAIPAFRMHPDIMETIDNRTFDKIKVGDPAVGVAAGAPQEAAR